MNEPTGIRNTLDTSYALKAMDYESYKKLVADLLLENKVTGPLQSEALTAYTRLNMHRMHRIEKTMKISPEVQTIVESIALPQTWLVLTEGWCGDAAQTVPVFHALSLLNKHIKLGLLLRDENPELMDQYLTNGRSRSIPKMIVYRDADMQERFNWGPRPAALQQLFMELKNKELSYESIKEEVHRWYAKDRTASTQSELGTLLKAVES